MNCSKGHLNAAPQPKEKPMTEQVAAPIPLEKLQDILSRMRARYMVEREHFDFKGLIDKQSTVLKGIIPQADIDMLVNLYIARRDEKTALKKQFDAEYALMDGDLETVATELKSRALFEKVEGFKCAAGTVYLSETMKVTGSDWGAFGQFLKTHDPLEFMEKRISSTAIKAYMKESGGELPPGVSIFKEIEARVRRAGEK
jgi:hypothetical protein